MTLPVITLYPDTIPNKGQAQTAFDANVDDFLTWQAVTFAPQLTPFINFANDLGAALVAGNLPPLDGLDNQSVRVNSDGSSVEFVDVALVGWTFLAATTTAAQRATLGLGSAALMVDSADADLTVAPDGAARRDIVAAAIAELRRGQVAWYAVNTAPTGTLKANGAAVSRTTYSALFAVIGTTFGVGDGTTTFNVPDMRGEFARGWDDGRGIDASRAFGSAQTDLIRAHNHSVSLRTGDGTSAPDVITGSGAAGASATLSTNNSVGAETRPRNIALLAVIFF